MVRILAYGAIIAAAWGAILMVIIHDAQAIAR